MKREKKRWKQSETVEEAVLIFLGGKLTAMLDHLDYLILERTSEWEGKVLGREQDYCQALRELDGCYQNLRELPGEMVEKEALIDKLQLAVGALERVEQQKAYKQGQRDGVRMRRWMEGKE